jgi:hypothetical protein
MKNRSKQMLQRDTVRFIPTLIKLDDKFVDSRRTLIQNGFTIQRTARDTRFYEANLPDGWSLDPTLKLGEVRILDDISNPRLTQRIEGDNFIKAMIYLEPVIVDEPAA